MAALLVAMGIMAVMLTVAMPVWKQAAQREKEEELIFRGMQYAHAIGMFQRKYANAYPPNFDVLVNERFLRKKFKDPITNDDFAPVLAGQTPGAPGPSGATGSTGATGRSDGPATISPTTPQRGQQPFGGQVGGQAGGRGGFGAAPGQVAGGIIGVTSKSKDKSIRLYNGRSHYNEWQFVWTQQVQAPGQPVPGPTGPGRGQSPFNQGGGIGGQRGGRGGPTGPDGRPTGPGGPGRGFNPFQPNPQQPTSPRGGRSGR